MGVGFNVPVEILDDPDRDEDLLREEWPDSWYGPGSGNGGSDTIYRLRDGIERFLITDINNPAASAEAQSSIPVMFDSVTTDARSYNHVPRGANVLYLDGHVEFLKYPSEYPVDEDSAYWVDTWSF